MDLDDMSPKTMFYTWGPYGGWMYGYKMWLRVATFSVMWLPLLIASIVVVTIILFILNPMFKIGGKLKEKLCNSTVAQSIRNLIVDPEAHNV